MMIDTHAHIYLDDFKADALDTMARAEEAGVEKIYMPNIDHTSIDPMLDWEMKFPGRCKPMMGLHPCSVKRDFEKELYRVEEWLAKRPFAAIGEMGTDLYWDKTFWEQQKEAFTVQVEWAKRYKRPLVIHCRQSIDETLTLLEPLADSTLTGVFHCFSGSADQAKRIINLGFFLGIGGVVTFKNGGLDNVLPQLSLHHLVLETDSPYLAPVPHRGKRNEPGYLSLIVARIAGVMNTTAAEVQAQTTANATKLFA
jgi:TatD DNase family protein